MLEIKASNTKKARYLIETNYTMFASFRKEVCSILDSELGEAYSRISIENTDEENRALFDKINKIISDRISDEYTGVLDFLFASDIHGIASPKTCGKIYELIKEVDFKDKRCMYRYYGGASSDVQRGDDYTIMKEFLLDCYEKHLKMIWS